MFWDIFKKKRSDGIGILAGSVIVNDDEAKKTETVKVPVRCKDGKFAIREKEISLARKKAIEALFLRVILDSDTLIDFEEKPRKRAGKTKVVARMRVLTKNNKDNKLQ